MSRDRFLEGMSRAAATVSIVTTDGPAGKAGVTVSSMSSVSADSERPSLLVCVHDASASAAAIAQNGRFCVNVLTDVQAKLSDVFAGRMGADDKFAHGNWTASPGGLPMLEGALVAYDCELKSDTLYGTHHIFIGEVDHTELAEAGIALVYANRSYGSTVPFGSSMASRRELAPDIDHEVVSLGAYPTLAPFVVPRLLAAFSETHPNLEIRVREENQSQLVRDLTRGDIDVALTYDFELPEDLDRSAVAQLATYALLPANHPLAREPEISLAALASEPMILLDLQPSRGYFTGLFATLGLTPNIAYRTTSHEMVRAMVGNGLGYALLGTRAASAVSVDGRATTTVALSDNLPPSSVVVVTRNQPQHSDAVTAMVAYLSSALQPDGSARPPAE